MAYYDKATSDELKDKFKDLSVPTGADFSGLVGYFDKGLQGMDEALPQTITQSAYNALTDDQKNTGTYVVIPDSTTTTATTATTATITVAPTTTTA